MSCEAIVGAAWRRGTEYSTGAWVGGPLRDPRDVRHRHLPNTQSSILGLNIRCVIRRATATLTVPVLYGPILSKSDSKYDPDLLA